SPLCGLLRMLRQSRTPDTHVFRFARPCIRVHLIWKTAGQKATKEQTSHVLRQGTHFEISLRVIPVVDPVQHAKKGVSRNRQVDLLFAVPLPLQVAEDRKSVVLGKEGGSRRA